MGGGRWATRWDVEDRFILWSRLPILFKLGSLAEGLSITEGIQGRNSHLNQLGTVVFYLELLGIHIKTDITLSVILLFQRFLVDLVSGKAKGGGALTMWMDTASYIDW